MDESGIGVVLDCCAGGRVAGAAVGGVGEERRVSSQVIGNEGEVFVVVPSACDESDAPDLGASAGTGGVVV